MAEIELGILRRQCLDRRIDNAETLTREVAAWEAERNASEAKVNWRFTTADARIKLKRLYPSIACSAGRVEMWCGGGEPLRFHIPLVKPDVRISRIRLSDKRGTRSPTRSCLQFHIGVGS